MKRVMFSLFAFGTVLFTACNSNNKREAEPAAADSLKKDTMQHAAATEDKAPTVVPITFTDVDVKAATAIKEIVDYYLQIKNALANDNGSEAAAGGKAMNEAIGKLDKSLLTAVQKKVFDNTEESLKEDAEHIGKNGDKVEHQREHFAAMSEAMYLLVKAFGGGKTIYHDHCPMYNQSQGGAMWLSETKEIRNPYYGNKMITCGSSEEVFK
jgi:hypothetical protein